MDAAYFRALFDYNAWAWERVLEQCGELSAEEYGRAFSFGSVRSVAAHALSVEHLWIQRCSLEGTGPWISGEEIETVSQLVAAVPGLEAELRRWVRQLTDEDLRREIAYRGYSGREFRHGMTMALAQLINHTTQHRSELAVALTEMGHSPGDLDLIIYVRDVVKAES
jgi:uncharacterized damage-inducible protein DinB